MNCKKAKRVMAAALSGGRGAHVADELRSHLERCAGCRCEWESMTSFWDDLGDLPIPVLPRADASRLLDRLAVAQQDLVAAAAPPKTERPAARRWLAAAAILAAMCLGAVLSRSAVALRVFPAGTTLPGADVALQDEDSLYLLLLHRPESVPPERGGERYQEWADRLRADDRLVTAHALDSADGWMVTGSDSSIAVGRLPPPVGELEGFFLIGADDPAAAIDAARNSPHLDYGGAIEVRRISR